MDYEKKYKESMDKMSAFLAKHDGFTISKDGEMYKELSEIFSELKESEDEKIIRDIRVVLERTATKFFKEEGKMPIWYDRAVAWLEKHGEPQDKGEISDGYHTFNELYYYRMLYNAAFFNMLPKEWVHKSKKHHDGEDCFGGGWFIVMANLPTGQISNHYELKDWDLFQIPEKEVADKWDGHTPQEAADRLHKYLLEYDDNYTVQKCSDVDRCARLWNITKDAKEGDVLCCESGWTCIFKALDNHTTTFSSYCFMDNTGWFCETGSEAHTLEKAFIKAYNGNIYPATKEQRDIFFQKMKEAGYEWDAEKKELKKVEQNSAWNPSDEQMDALRQVISGCSYDIEPLVEIEEQLKKLREE